MDEVTALTGALSTLGFPVVAFFLMYRMADKTIKENTAAITQLALTQEKICSQLNDNKHD